MRQGAEYRAIGAVETDSRRSDKVELTHTLEKPGVASFMLAAMLSNFDWLLKNQLINLCNWTPGPSLGVR